MKKILLLVVFALLCFSAGPASAFIHFTQNEFTTGESLDSGMTDAGIQFTIGDHYRSYYPEIRYGLGSFFEVGVKFGVTEAMFGPSDKTGGDKLGALLGADVKYQLVKETEGVPIDMAVDLGWDNTLISSRNLSELTFSTIFSKSIPLTDRGYKFVPYGGLEVSEVYGSLTPDNDTTYYGFVGMEWKITQKFLFMLEYKGGHSNIGGAAIRFEY